MRYKNIYSNHLLKIRIFTNSKIILRLVDNFLNFTRANSSKPKIKIDFYLDEVSSKKCNNDKNSLYQNCLDENRNLLSSFGKRIATLTADPKRELVKGTILNYEESSKEHLLDFILMQPLRFILAHHGFFFLHTSAVCKDESCTLIIGPQDSGKSTLALVLSQNGFNLLTDDDCFAKLVKNQTLLFPFPTKMGLNDKVLKKYPELNKLTLKNYRYGGKRRLSLNHISNPNNTKGLKCRMIIFPKYKADRDVNMKQLSKKDGLERLVKENLIIYNKERFPRRPINNFEVLCNIIEQANSFELTYNDNNLNRVTEVIKKIGNFKD